MKIKYAKVDLNCPMLGELEGYVTDKGVEAKNLQPGHIISWPTNDSDHPWNYGIFEVVDVTHDPGFTFSTGRVLRSPMTVITMRRNGKNRIITSMPGMWKRTYKK